jgi:Asp-tRNA(Asn)/Glu-tRNA(Gln) amidotransferase A subunit family amidase
MAQRGAQTVEVAAPAMPAEGDVSLIRFEFKFHLNDYVVALVYPTSRRTAARIGEPQTGGNCQASAASGLPAITVPAGFADDGMPVGVELLGRPFSEPDLLKLAFGFDQATHHRRLPALMPALSR